MGVKRDSVNRKDNLVKLSIALPASVKPGDKIELRDVKENEINPDIKDPMAGFGHPDGSNYGDAVFDPMAPGADETVFDPMK
jgi:hypothetical protein